MKAIEKAESLAREIVAAGPISGTLSSPRKTPDSKTGETPFDKIRLRPILLSGKNFFQLEQFRGPQVFHRNVSGTELENLLAGWLGSVYTRGEFATGSGSLQMLANRHGEISVIRKQGTVKAFVQDGNFSQDAGAAAAQACTDRLPELTTHNRNKTYILQEGIPVPFLVDLGVMSADGTVIKAKYDKFRQINRFLEFVADVLPELRRAAETGETGAGSLRELTVVDFGCGKSYLTFAVYYYLTALQNLPVRVIGLDLKKDVIAHCASLAENYGYDRLSFAVGDIAGYRGTETADMVITLHACDTATDFALAQAVRWGARVILSVPCCQHELNAELGKGDFYSPGKTTLAAAFRYGIIRERMAALFTDVMRAELLEASGYKVQILEFIDMSHTSKNLLIRAVRGTGSKDASAYESLRSFLGTAPSLERELEKSSDSKTDKEKETT